MTWGELGESVGDPSLQEIVLYNLSIEKTLTRSKYPRFHSLSPLTPTSFERYEGHLVLCPPCEGEYPLYHRTRAPASPFPYLGLEILAQTFEKRLKARWLLNGDEPCLLRGLIFLEAEVEGESRRCSVCFERLGPQSLFSSSHPVTAHYLARHTGILQLRVELLLAVARVRWPKSGNQLLPEPPRRPLSDRL